MKLAIYKYILIKFYYRKTLTFFSTYKNTLIKKFYFIFPFYCLTVIYSALFTNYKFFNLFNNYLYFYFIGFWILFKIKSFFNLNETSNIFIKLLFFFFSLFFLLLIFIHLIIPTSDYYVDIYNIYSSPGMQNASHFDKFCKLYENFKYWAFDPNFMTLEEELEHQIKLIDVLKNELQEKKDI